MSCSYFLGNSSREMINVMLESEINLEILLPKSSLSAIDWPCMFPTAPEFGTFEPEQADHVISPHGQNSAGDPSADNLSPREQFTADGSVSGPPLLYQQSWFYYLTEISLLRLSNRIIQSFYSAKPSEWLELPGIHMCNEVLGFQAQLQQW